MSNEIATTNPTQLIQMAVEQNADVDRLEKLMELQERWNAQQAKQSFDAAMADLQADLPTIKKLKEGAKTRGGELKFKYAPLEDIVKQVKEFISKHGFSYRFEQSQEDNLIKVTCVITHREGHSERLSLSGGADNDGQKTGVQSIASTVTYLRRYTFTGAFGIVVEDEDSDGRMPEPDIITEEQAAELKGMLQKAEADVKAFCKTFGCTAVDLLPAASHKRAKAMITAKMEAK